MIETRLITIIGHVQGVGMRPFLYRLANLYHLKGWVKNTESGVLVKISGNSPQVDQFQLAISESKPSSARIEQLASQVCPFEHFLHFKILESSQGKISTHIPTDVAMCHECIDELFDSNNRRYLYPFITCAACGPRFTILNSLPFDRHTTTMIDFPMCSDCLREYGDPLNRRFHAQTISCHSCGPRLLFKDKLNETQAHDDYAIQQAALKLTQGYIIAIKGIGGYQLAVDATNKDAVSKLRQRKRRKEKPFAIMAADLNQVNMLANFSETEKKILHSPQAPILLLAKKLNHLLPENIVFDSPLLGVMLPYSPLHLLLLKKTDNPLVITSANLSKEPIIIDDNFALSKLSDIADFFLIHNRKIIHHADDSVVRVIDDKPMVLRSARGYAPFYIPSCHQNQAHLALGGHLKNSFAIGIDKQMILSQHIGDLTSIKTFDVLSSEIASYQKMLRFIPDKIICDAHPDYGSSQIAKSFDKPIVTVQHHRSHILGCTLENNFKGQALSLGWDGAGVGDDGQMWGGEFFIFDSLNQKLERIASFLPFKLIGGDKAAKEPRRCALAMSELVFGSDYAIYLANFGADHCLLSFSWDEQKLLKHALSLNSHYHLTSSVGRLFDGIGSFLNLKQINSFEAQTAMILEGIADKKLDFCPYPIKLLPTPNLIYLDWRSMLVEILSEIKEGLSAEYIAARFHHTLIDGTQKICEHFGFSTLLLSGGVFQNKFLTELMIKHFTKLGIKVLTHSNVPTGDGGLAIGQLAYWHKEQSLCV